jgi:hypothetical protein
MVAEKSRLSNQTQVLEFDPDSIIGVQIGNNFIWTQITHRVGSITKLNGNFEPVWYFHFHVYADALQFCREIVSNDQASNAQARSAQRFSNQYEVKCWGMSEETAFQIAEEWANDDLSEAAYMDAAFKAVREKYDWIPMPTNGVRL